MDSKAIKRKDLQLIREELEDMSAKLRMSEIFAERRGAYLNENSLFMALFNSIPNCVQEICINCRKANTWFLETYSKDIKDHYFIKRYFNNNKKAEYDDMFYIFYEDLIVYFDTSNSQVKFLFRQIDISKVDSIMAGINKFKVRKVKRQPRISLLVNSPEGISTRSLKIIKPKLNIEDNYNDDFKAVHDTIFKRLSKKNDKGLVLLHGKPGTGKTSYIRYLIFSLKKDVIFLPPNMAGAITDPNLISILIDNPNSIFVIEDAENIIVDREKEGRSQVSALLNISDGLLSDCLNIQLICSFNTDISKVDNALMRKGRLIAKYEFKELETRKAIMLSQKLGFSTNINSPATLTAIYNQEDKEFNEIKQRSQIGFKAIQTYDN